MKSSPKYESYMSSLPPTLTSSPPRTTSPHRSLTTMINAGESFNLNLSSSSSSSSPSRSSEDQSFRTRQELHQLGIAKKVGSLRNSYSESMSIPLSPLTNKNHSSFPSSASDYPTRISSSTSQLDCSSSSSTSSSPGSTLANVLANMSLQADDSMTMTTPDQPNKRTSQKGKIAQAQVQVGASSCTSSTDGTCSPPTFSGSIETEIHKEEFTTRTIENALHKSTSQDDLTLLVINSGMTELSMSIEEVNTIIFEIQELRHSSTPEKLTNPETLSDSSNGGDVLSSSTNSSIESSTSRRAPQVPFDSLTSSISSLDLNENENKNERNRNGTRNTGLSLVDTALMRLQERLEGLAKEYRDLEDQITPYLGISSFLERKWKRLTEAYETSQKDCEMLSDELKEDQWLVVFRTVSSQAEEMMKSLEKVLKQAHEFVWELEHRPRERSNSIGLTTMRNRNGAEEESVSSGSTSSTSNKIANRRRMWFGETKENLQPLLTSFVALHSSLHSKIKYYAPACDRVLKILGKGISDRSTKNGEVLRRYSEMRTRWRNLVERIARVEIEMKGIEELLRQASITSSGEGELAFEKTSDEKSEGVLKKWANKVTGTSPGSLRKSTTTKPPLTARNPSRRLSQHSTPPPPVPTSRLIGLTPPHTPSKSPARATSRQGSSSIIARPTTPSSSSAIAKAAHQQSFLLTPPLPARGAHGSLPHRRTASTSTLGLPVSTTSRTHRSHSPSMSVDIQSEKPRWNSSTRPIDDKGSFPSPYNRPQSRTGISAAPRSVSSMSRYRPPSRNATRPISPTFSDDSTSFSGIRPGTPSKIPILSSRRSSINPSSIVAFDPIEPSSSMMQRVMSPTPSSSSVKRDALFRSTPTSRSKGSLGGSGSGIGNALSPPRAFSPTGSSRSSNNRANSQTPEPRLIAQAHRMMHVRAPRPPPVPVVPRNLRTPTGARTSFGATAGAGSIGMMRPGSSLGRSMTSYIDSSSSSSEEDSNEEGGRTKLASRYNPNPIDQLDLHISSIINEKLPIQIQVIRIDPPLTRAQVAQMEILQAKYLFALSKSKKELNQRRAVLCKLVDRLGPRMGRGEKKVVVRVGNGWQDLEAYAMALLAQSV